MKADLNKFLIYLKRSMERFEYVWFLEFQRRGAPHFHILLTLPGPGKCERELVAEIWSKIAEPVDLAYTGISSPYGRKNAVMGISTRDSVFKQHRRQRTWEAVRSEDGAARYALKYALKAKQKDVPSVYRDVGRFWGRSGGVKIKDVDFYLATEREAREAIVLLGRDMRGFEVLPKLIFHNGKLPP